MDSYAQQRPYSNKTPINRETNPNRRQLPSFREILAPPLHSSEPSRDSDLSNQPPSHRQAGLEVPSPSPPQSSPMPEAFYDIGSKTYDSANHFVPARTPSTWSGSSNYSDMTTYAHRPSFYSQPMAPVKHEPGLPSIRDMPFVASPTMPSPPYNNNTNNNNSMYGSVPSSAGSLQYGAPRRDAYSDNRSLSQTYPPYSRQYPHQIKNEWEQPYMSSPMTRMYQNPGHYQPSYAGDYSTSMHSQPYSLEHDRNNRKKRGNLPRHITEILKNWLAANVGHPYPSEEQKQDMVERTGLTMAQISNWFINARRRHLPRMKERMGEGANANQESDRPH